VKSKAPNPSNDLELWPILDREPEWGPLAKCLETRADWLNSGRDVKEKCKYDSLKMTRAWRLENPVLFQKYRAAQLQIEKDIERLRTAKVTIPSIAGVQLDRATWHLPGSTRDLSLGAL
jgi:hypothetical protein